MKKRFSVIVAAYNAEKYIAQTIDSVLSQTFQDYEIIVVDDGSNDKTPDILKSYQGQIKTIKQANQGPEIAYKTGSSFADGEYLAFLDSDDLFMPWALAIYDKIIQEFDAPPVIIGAMMYFIDGQDVKQRHFKNFDSIEVLQYRNYLSKGVSLGLSQSKIIMQKTLFEKENRPMMNLKELFFFPDYNLMISTGIYGPCIIIRQPVTIAYRQHATQNSRNLELMVQGLFSLMNAVTSGIYSRGSYHFAKYAYLGGPIWEWARKSLRNNRPDLALTLMIHGGPMLVAAALRKIWFRFFSPSTPIIIKNKE